MAPPPQRNFSGATCSDDIRTFPPGRYVHARTILPPSAPITEASRLKYYAITSAGPARVPIGSSQPHPQHPLFVGRRYLLFGAFYCCPRPFYPELFSLPIS